MAEKRMFSKQIVDSDAFLEMPLSTQALYFHLSMRADDDGFLNNANKIMKIVGANQNDYDLLVAKRFILQFEDGICVIKHWRMNNYLRNDRYKETVYIEQKQRLAIKENNAYTLDINSGIPLGIPFGNPDKNSIDKNSIDKSIYTTPTIEKTTKSTKHKYGSYNNVLLTEDEYQKLVSIADGEQAIQYMSEYLEMKGVKYKSHYLAIKKWVFDAIREKKQNNGFIKQKKQTPEWHDKYRKELDEKLKEREANASQEETVELAKELFE